jgi:type IV secretion system protein VirD4
MTAGIAASGGLAAIGVAILLSVLRAKKAQQVTTYGAARWADAREVADGARSPVGLRTGEN